MPQECVAFDRTKNTRATPTHACMQDCVGTFESRHISPVDPALLCARSRSTNFFLWWLRDDNIRPNTPSKWAGLVYPLLHSYRKSPCAFIPLGYTNSVMKTIYAAGSGTCQMGEYRTAYKPHFLSQNTKPEVHQPSRSRLQQRSMWNRVELCTLALMRALLNAKCLSFGMTAQLSSKVNFGQIYARMQHGCMLRRRRSGFEKQQVTSK